MFKHLWQKLTRGWSDQDLWNLDVTMAEFILPRLKGYKSQYIGTPMKEVTDGEPIAYTKEEYDQILNDMIICFELIIDIDSCDWSNERSEKIKHGLCLFTKFFNSLWI